MLYDGEIKFTETQQNLPHAALIMEIPIWGSRMIKQQYLRSVLEDIVPRRNNLVKAKQEQNQGNKLKCVILTIRISPSLRAYHVECCAVLGTSLGYFNWSGNFVLGAGFGNLHPHLWRIQSINVTHGTAKTCNFILFFFFFWGGGWIFISS